MGCFQFSGNLEYFGLVYNVDLFLAMYKCVSPLSLDPKRRIPETCLWQVKACVCYFSLFLKDKCISSLFRYSYFFFSLLHVHLFSPGLPRATRLLETSRLEKITMCNRDNAHDVAACPDE